MQGKFFAVVQPNPEKPNAFIIRRGVVEKPVGENWLLSFKGTTYNYEMVLSTDKLQGFAFFSTEAERQLFIDELTAGSEKAN